MRGSERPPGTDRALHPGQLSTPDWLQMQEDPGRTRGTECVLGQGGGPLCDNREPAQAAEATVLWTGERNSNGACPKTSKS